MLTYAQYFFDHLGQISSLLSVGIVWLGFAALGAVSSGPERIRALDPLIGWAWLGFAFTAFGVLFSVPFSYLSLAAAAAAISAGFLVWRREGSLLPLGFLRLLVLVLPLLVLVSAMQASQWDEFPHWLMIPRYMLETDALPAKDNLYPKAYLTAYPFSWHFVTYLASRVAGRLVENAGALTNVFLLLMFALVVVQLIARGTGRSDQGAGVSWSATALGGAVVFLANPTFTQKIVLTSYAETSSAVATGISVVLGWLICEAVRENNRQVARCYAWQMGAVLALLINLKQATMVLVVLVVLATFVAALRDRNISISLFSRQLPYIVIPAIVLYIIWRYHVFHELAGRELAIRPLGDWFFSLIPNILMQMALVLSKKGYYLALLVIAVFFGVRGFFRSLTPFDRFAIIVATVLLGYNGFLFFAYLASFGEYDAMRVASYWRYNMHLGPTLIAFSAYGAALVWSRYLKGKWNWHNLKWIPMILLFLAPFVFAHKIRFDKAPQIVHFRTVGAALPALLNEGDTYFICDPAGSGESSVIVNYELGHGAKFLGSVSAFTSNRLQSFKSSVARPELNTIVVFSFTSGFAETIGRSLKAGQTHLLRRKGQGPWQQVMSWPQPLVK